MDRKSDKAEELFFLMTLNDDFELGIRKIRRQFAIPADGCSTQKNAKEWIAQSQKSSLKLYERHFYQAAFLESHGVAASPALLHLLDDYILGDGRFTTMPKREELSFTIEPQSDAKALRGQRPFVKIWIDDTASIEDTVRYMRKSWKTIKLLMHQGDRVVVAARINPVRNKELVRAIIQLDKVPVKALRRIAHASPKSYRPVLIFTLLNKKTFPSLTEGSVRKTLERYRPYRRGRDDIDLKTYTKYILKEGTNGEKRELMGCFKSRLKFTKGVVTIEG